MSVAEKQAGSQKPLQKRKEGGDGWQRHAAALPVGLGHDEPLVGEIEEEERAA